MKAILLPVALLLAACASNTPQANVVSFHGSQPMSRGTIAVVPANPADAETLSFRVHADSIAAELRRNGYTPVPSRAAAQYVAVVSIDQQGRAAPPRQSGLTIGLGGSMSSGNVGIGSSVQVPVGGQQQSGGIIATTLTVRINSATGSTPVWEGRATKEAPAGTPAADTSTAVPLLATALFSDFPGPSGKMRTIRL